MFHPEKFWINIFVDPAVEGRGIGRAIYERLNGELRKLNAIGAWAGSTEKLPRLTEFYQRRGFEEKMKAWESRLDVVTIDLEKFRNYNEKVLRQGVKITNLPEEGTSGPDSLKRLPEARQLILTDMTSSSTFTTI